MNGQPMPSDDEFFVQHDGFLSSMTVVGNDSDFDGDQLTFSLGTGPQHGVLNFGNDGTFDYTPTAGWAGVDTFTYLASDGVAAPVLATVTINVTNHPPTPENDEFSVIHDRLLEGNVATNDTSFDGDPLTFTLGDGPENGELVFNPDGTFEYQPDMLWVGEDSFTYQVSDGVAAPVLATVTIHVTNQAPVAVDDEYAVAYQTELDTATLGLGGRVGGNDSDFDGDTLIAVLVNGPAHGTLDFRDDGTFSYTPEDGYSGSDEFKYLVWDGITSDIGQVTLNIGLPVNRPPQFDHVTYHFPVDRNQPGPPIGDVHATDPDGDSVTYRIIGDELGELPVIMNSNGHLQWRDSNFEVPENFSVSFEVGATDGNPENPESVANVWIGVKLPGTPPDFLENSIARYTYDPDRFPGAGWGVKVVLPRNSTPSAPLVLLTLPYREVDGHSVSVSSNLPSDLFEVTLFGGENGGTVTVGLSVENSTGPHTWPKSLTDIWWRVTVSDVNGDDTIPIAFVLQDNRAPVFTQQEYVIYVTPTTPAGVILAGARLAKLPHETPEFAPLRMIALDPDGDPVIMSLLDGNITGVTVHHDGTIEVNSAAGLISLMEINAQGGREPLVLSVVAQDPWGLSATARLVIKLAPDSGEGERAALIAEITGYRNLWKTNWESFVTDMRTAAREAAQELHNVHLGAYAAASGSVNNVGNMVWAGTSFIPLGVASVSELGFTSAAMGPAGVVGAAIGLASVLMQISYAAWASDQAATAEQYFDIIKTTIDANRDADRANLTTIYQLENDRFADFLRAIPTGVEGNALLRTYLDSLKQRRPLPNTPPIESNEVYANYAFAMADAHNWGILWFHGRRVNAQGAVLVDHPWEWVDASCSIPGSAIAASLNSKGIGGPRGRRSIESDYQIIPN